MNDKNPEQALAVELRPTPTNLNLPLRTTGYGSLTEALEYAACGESGFNFYGHSGQLEHVLSYRQLLEDARILARKLNSLGCARGSRVGIIAETDPAFHRFFFACQLAGLVPVAVPASIQLGAHAAYVSQVQRMLRVCGAEIVAAPLSHEPFLSEITASLDLVMSGVPTDFDTLPESSQALQPLANTELAYLQYTSGSTRFPCGVEVTQNAVLDNLQRIARDGLQLTAEDRFVSWLPFYHDMGMIGFILVPLIAQLSADYITSRTFAMRPRLWLKIISDNRGTVSSSPTFGYALCARRLRPVDYERFDLRSWRAACVGAEHIKSAPLAAFAEALAPCGFDPKSFTACYGMAETVLAVSFAPLGEGLCIDTVDREQMSANGAAVAVPADHANATEYVDCGSLLPGFSLSIRDAEGTELPERQCGQIFLRGPSVMRGYFEDPKSTAEVLSADGWMNTGDIGYRLGSHLVITSRSKDVIIIKGRNIWPHDIENMVEQLDGTRLGGVAAFAISRGIDEDQTVVLVETRERDLTKRESLLQQIRSLTHENFGINVVVELVTPGTLPRTSSGKLSRTQSRKGYFERRARKPESLARETTPAAASIKSA